MTDAELGIELYVVIGNCLHLVLRGMRSAGQPRCDLLPETMKRLDDTLTHLQPDTILAGIRSLSQPERQFLAKCCRCALVLAADEVDTALGAPASLIEELVRWIEAL